MEAVSVNLSKDVTLIFRGMDFLYVQKDFFVWISMRERNFQNLNHHSP